MSVFSELLGDTLTSKDGDVKTADALAGKTTVGLYFSAHWCPPCRGFTPKLAKAYTDSLKAKGMEIVFVSSDRDDDAFKEYFGEQPWLSLPFQNRDAKNKLSKKYKVSGIPSFVILDGETGETITKDGRSNISEDPSGTKYPWKPPTFWEALGDEFLDGTDGETKSLDEVKQTAKYIGLYFSAHWCPPCRGFTPKLVTAYNDHLKAKGLEIIFVSSDRDQASFLEYYGEQRPGGEGWLAIPNGDARKAALSKLFEVEGIPTFVVVDAATGETITTDAVGSVSTDPEGEEFPWHPKPLNDMSSGSGVDKLNEELSLCVLLDGCDKASAAAAKAALEPIAEASVAGGSSTCFFYASSGDGPVGQVRKLCGLSDVSPSPQMVLLDIPDNGGYYVSAATEVSAETVNAFLDEYKAGKLQRKQLS